MPKGRWGKIFLKVDGEIIEAEGNFTFNFGTMKKEEVMNAAGEYVGSKETPQPAMIEGNIILTKDQDWQGVTSIEDSTVTLELRDATLVLSEADYHGDGTGNTEDGKMDVKFVGTELNKI